MEWLIGQSVKIQKLDKDDEILASGTVESVSTIGFELITDNSSTSYIWNSLRNYKIVTLLSGTG